MMRVKASSLQELAKLVAEKLKVELPDDVGAADVSMLEPGRKVPSPALTPFIDSLADSLAETELLRLSCNSAVWFRSRRT